MIFTELHIDKFVKNNTINTNTDTNVNLKVFMVIFIVKKYLHNLKN
jgi:hypothetical protein